MSELRERKWKVLVEVGIFVVFSISLVQSSFAANFMIRNVSNTSQIYFIVNGTTGYVGIGLSNPLYPLHVIGDVYWSGTLQGGIVPWERLTGYNLDVAWSGKLGWGNLSGYNLNVNWQGKLGWGNLTGYNLNVGWTGLLGWGNLTGYNLNVQWIGSLGGGNITPGTIDASRFVPDLNLGWGNLTNYPSGCPEGYAVQTIEDTLICVQINATQGVGNASGSGIANALAYWVGDTTLGALSFGTSGQFLKSQGSNNQPIWATIILGTDTEGDYIKNITAGTGIVISGTPSEGWIPTIAIDTNIIPRKNIAETITASWTFAENVWFNKNVFIAGNLSYVNVNTLNVNGSLIPIFNGQFDVGNLTYKWRNVTAINIVGDNVYSGGYPVLTTATNFEGDVSGTYNSLQLGAGVVGTNELATIDCGTGKVLQRIGGGTYVCVDVNPANVTNGTGSPGQVAFFTGSNSITGSDNLFWDNSNGRLGIGTTSPVKKLDVVGDINATQAIYSINGYYVGTNQIIDSAGNANFASLKIGGTTVIDSNRNVINVNWVNASYLNISAGLTVLPNGNVGIGTTSPSEKLEVSGNIKLSGYINVAGSYIRKVGSSIVISDV